jgi:predicted SnoaL-like aldol condensation-catalyzing enzyme
VVAPTASGNGETDGPADVTRPQQGARNGRLIGYLIDTILVGRKHDRLKHFFVANLIQHDPLVDNGVKALAAAWQAPGTAYEHRHLTLADGEFVLTVSTGTVRHAPRVFYDLFRVDRGMVVEHWNVTTEPGALPAATPAAPTEGQDS